MIACHARNRTLSGNIGSGSRLAMRLVFDVADTSATCTFPAQVVTALRPTAIPKPLATTRG